MFKRLSLFASVAAAILGPASAETLQDALAMAYQTNPTIRAERARLRATEQLKAQAWSQTLPQVRANAAYSKLDETQTLNPVISGGGTQEVDLNPLTADVSAEQLIFNGFRNINAIKQARARVRAGGAQLIGVEQDVLTRVATAYFDVLRDETNFESNRKNVEVLIRQKQEADLRFKVGEVTKTDVAQADARLAGARAGLAASQARLAASRAIYAELVGQAPQTLEPTPQLPSLPESLDAAKALADEYSPRVVAAREIEDASRKQVAIAKGAIAPTISVTAGYQYAEEPSTFVEKDESFSYGIRASAPIFLGGANWSRIKEARALYDSSRQETYEAERRAESEVTVAWEQYVAAGLTINSASAQVSANELALTGVRRESQVGTRSTLDVLNAELELLNSRLNLANAQRDERVAAFALLAAAGVLNPDAIGIDAEALIPKDD